MTASTNGFFEYQVTTEDTDETVTLHLKPSSRMPWRIVKAVMLDPEQERQAAITMLDWALSPEEVLIVDRVPHSAVTAMMNAWQEDGGITVGESPASAASSKTKRSAKP